MVSGEVFDHEGEENTDDVDSRAFPSSAVVLVLEVQVTVIAGQFCLG